MKSRVLQKRWCLVVGSAVMAVLAPSLSHGNDSLLSLSQLAASGRHREVVAAALSRGELPLADRFLAAKSAWAIGLVGQARTFWDDALNDPRFTGPEKSREQLGRAILELQERNYGEAILQGERAARALEPSDLRAQLWLVVGQALQGQGAVRQATEYFQRAVNESRGAVRSEALFHLGESQLRSGLSEKARYSFAGVDAESAQASRAMKRLAEIDLAQKNFEGVLTWVREGRQRFPELFAESWFSYAAVVSLLALHHEGEAAEELDRFGVKFTEREPWYALAAAAYEASAVARRFEEQGVSGRNGLR